MTTTSTTPEVGNEFYRELLMNLFNNSYGRERPGYIQHQNLLRQQSSDISAQSLKSLRAMLFMLFPLFVGAFASLILLSVFHNPVNSNAAYAVFGVALVYLGYKLGMGWVYYRQQTALNKTIDWEELYRFDETYSIFWKLHPEGKIDWCLRPVLTSVDLKAYLLWDIESMVWWIKNCNIAVGPNDVLYKQRQRLKLLVNLAVHLGICGAENTGLPFDGGSQMFYSGQAKVVFVRLFGPENIGAC